MDRTCNERKKKEKEQRQILQRDLKNSCKKLEKMKSPLLKDMRKRKHSKESQRREKELSAFLTLPVTLAVGVATLGLINRV